MRNLVRWLFLVVVSAMLVACVSGTRSDAGTPPPTTPAAGVTPSEESPALAAPVVEVATSEPAGSDSATAIPTATVHESGDTEPTATPITERSGALVGVSMDSRVGVVLDDFPVEMRDQVAAELLAQSESDWAARAERQIRLLKLRLNFRSFFQSGKGQLPLPPREIWDIVLDPAGPSRQTIDGHDAVVWPYRFSSTLLTDDMSPGQSEPALAEVGGVWNEPFVLPVDPDMLFQRTGNACVNEGGYPPNSYDSENIAHFYDFACTADSVGATGCHRTVRPELSCREALQSRVGAVETAVRFERLPWDAGLADSVRTGQITAPNAPDLLVVGDDLDINRVVYRYFRDDDCAIAEGAVGGSGWRRLLQFDATLHNVGGQALHVGPVIAEDLEHHVFEYSPCHDHFHYSNYGTFQLRDRDDVTASKQAFCVQSTSRYSNNELSPFGHAYTCSFQGIQAGWVDEYPAGLDVQWIDITDLQFNGDSQVVQLGFVSNQGQFLCEGTPIVDDNGNRLWEATDQTTADGHVIERPLCEFLPNWDINNFDERDVTLSRTGSLVTAACATNQVGPLRNCGFQTPEPEPAACTPGEPVSLRLSLPAGSAAQVLRVCERSDVLGVGVACAYNDAVANRVLSAGEQVVSFTCPVMRDSATGAGGYSLYVAPVWPGDAAVMPSISN